MSDEAHFYAGEHAAHTAPIPDEAVTDARQGGAIGVVPMSKSPTGKKVAIVMNEWGKGQLRSGSSKGPKVTDQKQAVAIALASQRAADKKRK